MTVKYLRYADLAERQIVNNRTTLTRWIDEEGFPAGIMLGPNTRAWANDQVDAWLESRGVTNQLQRLRSGRLTNARVRKRDRRLEP